MAFVQFMCMKMTLPMKLLLSIIFYWMLMKLFISIVFLDMVVYLMPCSFKFVFINFIGAHVVIVSVNDLYSKQSAFLPFLIAHWNNICHTYHTCLLVWPLFYGKCLMFFPFWLCLVVVSHFPQDSSFNFIYINFIFYFTLPLGKARQCITRWCCPIDKMFILAP